MKKNLTVLTALLFIAVLQSCTKTPEASFSYTPADNPEAGDTIRMTNTSVNAESYDWNFGNSISSIDESPYVIYDESGKYEITLKANGAKGSDSTSQNILIKEPTVMSFAVFDTDSVTPLSDCEIWLYGTEAELEDWYSSPWDDLPTPIRYGITDAQGEATFYNLESIIYYVTIFKDIDENGYLNWGGWNTNPLVLNSQNHFNILLAYYEYTVAKSSNTGSRIHSLKYISPIEPVK